MIISSDEARKILNFGGVVVDVRTTEEFESGHAPGSLHLPLHILPMVAKERLPEHRTLLVCCASGARSFVAVEHLRRMGYQAENLGPWTYRPDLP
jgi:rhodanese-related sulfurtransferase